MNFSGAGVLIIIKINNINHFILGRGLKSKKYGDFGGFSEKYDKSIAHTASRELLEETEGIINIKPSKLIKTKYIIDIVDRKGSKFYKCYIIGVNNNKLFNLNNFSKYGEIDKIKYVPFNKINKTNISNRLKKILFNYKKKIEANNL
jgi:hypothetical protein